eukprot:3241772-Pyramimonas_sp.AAC.1
MNGRGVIEVGGSAVRGGRSVQTVPVIGLGPSAVSVGGSCLADTPPGGAIRYRELTVETPVART